MAYKKLGFADSVTPLDAEHFNHMEEGIAALDVGKQNKLTGTQGQIVGFDANGNAVAQAAPESGGGTVEVDATLSVTGKAADAKATGDAIKTEETARKAEIDVERKRINALSSLGSGSTTGDAELIDGRTDAEGVTHANIGSAIRHIHKDLIGTQDGDLINREAVDEERTTFFEVSSNVLPDVEVDTTNPGMILNTNTGELYAANGATTDYFRLNPNTTYYWRTDQVRTNTRMCLYDSEKNFVQYISNPTSQNVDKIFETPANTRYARLSHMGCTDYTKGVDIYFFYIGEEPYDSYCFITPGCKRFVYDVTESVETEVINIMQYEPRYVDYRSNQAAIGQFKDISALMGATSGYTASDYIPIHAGTKTLHVGRRSHEYNNGAISYPAFDQTIINFFDERKRCISKGYKSPDGSVPVPKWARYFTIYMNTGFFDWIVIFEDVRPEEFKYPAPVLNSELAKKIYRLNGNEIAFIPEVFPWQGKTWLSYGDSITAIGHGDNSWHNYVKKKLRLDGQYVRGVGGSFYTYTSGVVFANADGSYHSRNDNASMLDPSSYTLPSGCTAHWNYMASWSRIKTQIPDDIKDDIDLIFLFNINNGPYMTEPITEIPGFVSGATKDADWAAAAENTLGGDFDITTIHGAIASTLLKLQTRCPNALIVIGTGWSGRNDESTLKNTGDYGSGGKGIYYLGQTVKNVANYFSFNVLDLWGTTQVNPWNRTDYNADNVHPYLDKGKKALARAVISGLSKLHPRFDTD